MSDNKELVDYVLNTTKDFGKRDLRLYRLSTVGDKIKTIPLYHEFEYVEHIRIALKELMSFKFYKDYLGTAQFVIIEHFDKGFPRIVATFYYREVDDLHNIIK